MNLSYSTRSINHRFCYILISWYYVHVQLCMFLPHICRVGGQGVVWGEVEVARPTWDNNRHGNHYDMAHVLTCAVVFLLAGDGLDGSPLHKQHVIIPCM